VDQPQLLSRQNSPNDRGGLVFAPVREKIATEKEKKTTERKKKDIKTSNTKK